jgi:taurine---2-oxoglutarate transaminase
MDLVRRQGERVFYTWTAQKDAQPLTVIGGNGARFSTLDATDWIDLGSMTWNAHLGQQHPRMMQALAAEAGRGLVAPPTAVFETKARAGELLAEVTPAGLGKSFLCLSGAEANENAVKIARLVTGRRKVVARSRSYHGATLAMLSLSGDPRRDRFEPGLPGVVRMADPYCYRCPFGKKRESCAIECASDLETVLLREGPDTVAAVILEGAVGANGVFWPREGYFGRIREICDRHGVLLIDDEVLSGFGRTGRWFAIDHDGVSPDMLTCAKGLTAGYAPGGAVVVSERIARHFDDDVLVCGLTSYGHPLACAAMVAAIETYRSERLVDRAAALGAWLGNALRALARPRPFVGEVRGVGLLWALELVVPPGTVPAPADRMTRLVRALRARHVWTHERNNWMFIAPPLVSAEADLAEGLERMGAALDEVFS